MAFLKKRILEYADHLEERAYMDSVLAVGTPAVLEAVIELLQSDSLEDVFHSDLFVRDALRIYRRDNPDFIASLLTSKIPATYRANAVSRNPGKRSVAVMSLCDSIGWNDPQDIRFVLSDLKEHDPLLIPKLLGHHQSLIEHDDWLEVQKVASHGSFLVRWSLVELLDQWLTFPLPVERIMNPTRELLQRLQNDENRMVSNEAGFLARKLDYYEIMPTLPKPEKRRRSKDLNREQPNLRFESLRIQFGNFLFQRGNPEFTIGELEAFVQSLSEPA